LRTYSTRGISARVALQEFSCLGHFQGSVDKGLPARASDGFHRLAGCCRLPGCPGSKRGENCVAPSFLSFFITARGAKMEGHKRDAASTLQAGSAVETANPSSSNCRPAFAPASPSDSTVARYYVPRRFVERSKLQAYLSAKTPGTVSLPKRDYNLYEVTHFFVE
jgi:hypothetical protein